MPQNHPSYPYVSGIRLSTHYSEKARADYVFHDVQSTDCNELLVVLLLERDGEVKNRLYEIHKCGVRAQDDV